jgi:acetyl-CoA carboxylase biotin carboxylase subunit
MFERILIANRGEIAVRIARTCHEMGIEPVLVYSGADASSAARQHAARAVRVGTDQPAGSYLYIPNIIEAALRVGADAIHPGYGFLSEDPYFAEICQDNDITFIGPPPGVMELVGSKATTRRLMTAAGLPLLAGTTDAVTSVEQARAIADRIGYPLIIKAVAGGGGRGITVVHHPSELERAYRATRASALATFRDSSVYIEQYLSRARHIEVQVLCDAHGNGVHLGERDCSVQRRHQKLIEESPSPALTPAMRERIGAAAVTGALAVGYQGAGTMEFLLDDDGNHWFMEMNGRIQVEHPVTEMVTGIDLVRQQILIAAGQPLAFGQDEVRLHGHSIECRINAEDPTRDFAPTPGRLDVFTPPGGPWTRVDTHCVAGSSIPPFYDSLIAKLIVWAPTRAEAIARMRRALGEFRIEGRGVKTTVGFHEQIMAEQEFILGEVRLDFLTTLSQAESKVIQTA